MRTEHYKPDLNQAGILSFLTPAEMYSLGRLTLHSRYVVEGNLAGAHRSPFHGPSSEFADHKAYGIGDDPKNIDWRVVARTNKYYVKRFQDETNLRVYLVVDRSASMAFGSGDCTKYAFACRLAVALGYVVVKGRDSVGLALHADKIDVMMEAHSSLVHLNNIVKSLRRYEPASTTRIAGALHEVAEKAGRRALIVVISDLLGDGEEIRMALAHLRKRHHDVMVMQVLDPNELNLNYGKTCEFVDLETTDRLVVNPRGLAGEYQRVFGDFLKSIQEYCSGLKADYRLACTDQSLETFVRAYLGERNRLAK